MDCRFCGCTLNCNNANAAKVRQGHLNRCPEYLEYQTLLFQGCGINTNIVDNTENEYTVDNLSGGYDLNIFDEEDNDLRNLNDEAIFMFGEDRINFLDYDQNKDSLPNSEYLLYQYNLLSKYNIDGAVPITTGFSRCRDNGEMVKSFWGNYVIINRFIVRYALSDHAGDDLIETLRILFRVNKIYAPLPNCFRIIRRSINRSISEDYYFERIVLPYCP